MAGGKGCRPDRASGQSDGRLDLDLLARELDNRVLLVAVMQVNNEIGVTQPISEIADDGT